MPFLGMVAQRVLANQPVGQVHIDMGTGGEGGQWLAVNRVSS